MEVKRNKSNWKSGIIFLLGLFLFTVIVGMFTSSVVTFILSGLLLLGLSYLGVTQGGGIHTNSGWAWFYCLVGAGAGLLGSGLIQTISSSEDGPLFAIGLALAFIIASIHQLDTTDEDQS